MHGSSDDHHHPHSRRLTSRRRLLRGATAAGLAVPMSRLSWAAAPAAAAEMAQAAGAWLGGLDARQRRAAQLEWSDGGRESWHYIPRGGVPD